MKASELISELDKDFDIKNCEDDWRMDFNKYITEWFKQKQMGLMLDNADKFNQVFTAVFPSRKVLQELYDKKVKNALLVTHHPMIWDIRKENVFTEISTKDYKKLRNNNNISLYIMHVLLDKPGEYSTGKTLANALGVKTLRTFYEYTGEDMGVIAETRYKTITELLKKVSETIGHEAGLYKYGSDEIKNNRIGIVPGGGNDKEIHEELAKLGINVLVTGITALNDYSREAHEYAKKKGINIIGGTHYSTEKFACQELCNYFKKKELTCEFIPDEPVMEDM